MSVKTKKLPLAKGRNGAPGGKRDFPGLLRFFLRHYPGRFFSIFAVSLLTSLVESIGLISLLPVIQFIVSPAGTPVENSPVQSFVDGLLSFLGLDRTIESLLILVLALILSKAVLQFAMLHYKNLVQTRMVREFRTGISEKLMTAQWRYFTTLPAGRISSALLVEAPQAASVFSAIILAFALMAQSILFVVTAYAISAPVAAAAMGIGAVIWLLFRVFVTMSHRAGQRQIGLTKHISESVVDSLQGIKPLKAMGAERSLFAELSQQIAALRSAEVQEMTAKIYVRTLREPIIAICLLAGLYVALHYQVAALPQIVVLALIFHRLVSTIAEIQSHFQNVAQKEPFFWAFHELDAALGKETERAHGGAQPTLDKGIEIAGLSFGYGGRQILSDLNFTMPARTITAIIGPSGAGKTTLIDLLCGLLDYENGHIRIDGRELAELDLTAWRRMIGYVPQELFLFHGTLRDNVTLGAANISDDKVRAALSKAGAWTFVQELPDGLDTDMGERGSRLSGGQRQRVSIARALVRQPKFLVLDEATSALDPETQDRINATIKELAGEMTIVSISHQHHALGIADQVIALEGGRTKRMDQSQVAG